MNILMLADYVEGYNCPASFKIRYITGKLISEKGHNVTFVYPSNASLTPVIVDETETFRTISTLGLLPNKLRTGGFSVLDILFKAKLVLFEKYDVIHVTCGHRPAQIIPALIGKYLKGSMIVDEWWEWYGRGGYASLREGIIGRITAGYDLLFELPAKRCYDGVIAITNVLKNRLKNNRHVEVMHGGTEVDTLFDYDVRSARTYLNLPEDHFIIGISNLGEDDYSDNKLFFDAFSRLEKEYENIRLFITGEKEYIIKYINSVSYKDKIIYAGWLEFDNYNRYLSACNIFVLPLRNNPRNAGRWPNKIGDYLCLNRPIITNPTGDILELFNRYKIGFICEETVDAFYHLLKRILEKEIQLDAYHQDSKYVASEALSFDRRVDSILRFYEKCLNRRR